jgi:hypothetical protein
VDFPDEHALVYVPVDAHDTPERAQAVKRCVRGRIQRFLVTLFATSWFTSHSIMTQMHGMQTIPSCEICVSGNVYDSTKDT